jgi:hypothetical protein
MRQNLMVFARFGACALGSVWVPFHRWSSAAPAVSPGFPAPAHPLGTESPLKINKLGGRESNDAREH